MALSAAQMAQMSRLLDEALPLDAAGRRRWLEQLAPEHRELESALRQALLPQDGASSEPIQVGTLPKINAGDTTMPVRGLERGARVGPYRLERDSSRSSAATGAHRPGGAVELWRDDLDERRATNKMRGSVAAREMMPALIDAGKVSSSASRSMRIPPDFGGTWDMDPVQRSGRCPVVC